MNDMPSLRELYRIGYGPSSSHTIGPGRACTLFKEKNKEADFFRVQLFGSLSKTGKGHRTDEAIQKSFFPIKCSVDFCDSEQDLEHPNTMKLYAYQNGVQVDCCTAFSVGGGEIKSRDLRIPEVKRPYELTTFSQLAEYCQSRQIRIWQYVEQAEGQEIWEYLSLVWDTMKESIRSGLEAEGTLPGRLQVQRRAKELYRQRKKVESPQTYENRMVSAYAFAVSEQNAAGEMVVTAPTCGSAGVLPAALWYEQQKEGFSDRQIYHALATAGIIGNLIKTNASVSGAECGCQAEIGSACSMAAAGLGELFSMEIPQIEYGAEIAMEHHLGLTCDPIFGLVQIPCIERNAVAAMRAVNAVSLANFLTDSRKISFDLVVQTMYETGKDLAKQYRETGEGGLAKLYQ
ncbi:MAG: L-serine ammonia-lyase [Clostridia bacterium]|nr:L-serine ammonia-lyase [Clostridia bacterium]